jgi:uncharacterized protein
MPFLTARWSNLILLTYAVPPALLQHRVPDELELDTRDGQAFASLVAFDFLDTRVLGVAWPGFRKFPEVNLRFYVRDQRGGARGVMFVKEFVPQRFVACVARAIYNEPYEAVPMRSVVNVSGETISVAHEFDAGGRTNSICATGDVATKCPAESSDAHFFKEHRWGFGRTRGGRCIRYEVVHPVWNCHAVRTWSLQLDWARVYGGEWAFLQEARPVSVVLAEGSGVQVLTKRAMDAMPA